MQEAESVDEKSRSLFLKKVLKTGAELKKSFGQEETKVKGRKLNYLSFCYSQDNRVSLQTMFDNNIFGMMKWSKVIVVVQLL